MSDKPPEVGFADNFLLQRSFATLELNKACRFLISAHEAAQPIHRASAAILVRRQARDLPRSGTRKKQEPQIEVKVRSELPPLAWLCTRRSRSYEFLLGRAVEHLSGGYFEGVWDGDFDDVPNLPSHLHFGSGAVFARDSVLFLPPKHLFEFLYIVRDRGRNIDFISNSLCFCLRAANVSEAFLELLEERVIPDTHRATMLGAYLSETRPIENENFALYRMMYHNFAVDPCGGIQLQPYYHGRTFRSFADYRAYLAGTLRRVFFNGSGPARRVALAPIASVSCGYDSTAVAALASEEGCRDAVTLAISVGGIDDCGTEVAQKLGMNIQEFSHVLGKDIYTLRTDFAPDVASAAAEFIATAGIGDDVNFLTFEPALGSRILLTGAWGDSIWPKDPDVHAGLPIRILFGKSLTEFRLRVGFAHVPVPTIGGVLPRSIVAISRGSDMAEYSIGGDYDRPIPRRIGEEAGVPRMAFGTRKNATAPLALNHATLWRPAIQETMFRYELAVNNATD